jgi:hypothetical protein
MRIDEDGLNSSRSYAQRMERGYSMSIDDVPTTQANKKMPSTIKFELNEEEKKEDVAAGEVDVDDIQIDLGSETIELKKHKS